MVDSPTPEVPGDVARFAALFYAKTAQYVGEGVHLGCAAWTPKRIALITDVLAQCTAQGVDPAIYVVFLCDVARREPAILWPSRVQSARTLARCRRWMGGHASTRDVYRRDVAESLESLLRRNQERYQYYRETLGWPDAVIFRARATEFDPFYLLALPQFAQAVGVPPAVVARVRDAQLVLRQDPTTARAFWQLAKRVTCLTRRTNSGSCSKARS